MSATGDDSTTDSRTGTVASSITSNEMNDAAAGVKEIPDPEDVEGMDSKAKALMHLLKTSSVRIQLHSSYPVTLV